MTPIKNDEKKRSKYLFTDSREKYYARTVQNSISKLFKYLS